VKLDKMAYNSTCINCPRIKQNKTHQKCERSIGSAYTKTHSCSANTNECKNLY